MHLFANAWMQFSFCFFDVQALQPYVAAGQTTVKPVAVQPAVSKLIEYFI